MPIGRKIVASLFFRFRRVWTLRLLAQEMINTLNETKLHKTLKTLYAQQHEHSQVEAEIGPYIADILTADGSVIEIQTASLAHLLPKVQYCLTARRKITIVHPIAAEKYIETTDSAGTRISRRKSPQKKSLYTSFREYTGFAEVLLNPLVTVEVLEACITEERETTPAPVQSRNGRRRFKKTWIKTGKRLEAIYTTPVLHGRKAYLALLPDSLKEPFTVQQLTEALQREGKKVHTQDTRLLLWVFTKAGLVDVDKTSRPHQYYKKIS